MRTLCKLPKKQKILFSVLHFDVQIVFYYMSGIHMHISTGHTMASGSPNQIKCGKEEELWKRNKWKWARKPSRPPLYWSKRTLWHKWFQKLIESFFIPPSSVKVYAQIWFWYLAEIYYRGAFAPPWLRLRPACWKVTKGRLSRPL